MSWAQGYPCVPLDIAQQGTPSPPGGPAKARHYPMAVGLYMDHKVTKCKQAQTSGWLIQEWPTLELLKLSKDKRTLRFMEKKVGTYIQAKKKRDE
ncbi:60S ribosomal protein L36 [Galemys pyrenaicus]|uniref:Large ribosomal subunit protein eL36 n=1 Tax=Galemys pyrenaicus TaxID=202257 RepID=A0A8J6AJG0_GALPY|nr:60S ribosomal protein L36 [Galemys pyrenaicus]